MTVLYRKVNGAWQSSNVKPGKVSQLKRKGWVEEVPEPPKKRGRKPNVDKAETD